MQKLGKFLPELEDGGTDGVQEQQLAVLEKLHEDGEQLKRKRKAAKQN